MLCLIYHSSFTVLQNCKKKSGKNQVTVKSWKYEERKKNILGPGSSLTQARKKRINRVDPKLSSKSNQIDCWLLFECWIWDVSTCQNVKSKIKYVEVTWKNCQKLREAEKQNKIDEEVIRNQSCGKEEAMWKGDLKPYLSAH